MCLTRGRVITLVFFMRRHGLCMLALDGTFAQAEMPVYPRILQFFVTKCVHVYPDGRLVSGSKMGPCRRIFNASVLTRPPSNSILTFYKKQFSCSRKGIKISLITAFACRQPSEVVNKTNIDLLN